jgi:cobaltochelatase CobN
MHRLAATPGGWDSSQEGVVFIEQTPAQIVLLTAADTDISTLSQVLTRLPKNFSDIRSVSLLQLQQQLTIDTYAEGVLRHARLIILRLLGGRAYWAYGLEVVRAVVTRSQAHLPAHLVVMPGDDRPDLDLMSHSTVPLAVVNQLWQYFVEGGVDNICNGLMYVSDRTLATQYNPPAPINISRVGICALSTIGISTDLAPDLTAKSTSDLIPNIDFISQQKSLNNLSGKSKLLLNQTTAPVEKASVGILFYRAHFLAGNTKVIEALAAALILRGLKPLPIYVSSLKEFEIQQTLMRYCQADAIELLINTTSFAITDLNSPTAGSLSSAQSASKARFNLWQALDIPVLQVICSGSLREHWQNHPQGLAPRDIAMNVALPEVDGRIITRAVSFKAAQPTLPVNRADRSLQTDKSLQTDVVIYEPEGDRIQFVADLAARWIRLGRTPPANRKIALILANYPNRDGRIANGVGLDTPASCLAILQALQQAGYCVGDIPQTGSALIHQLTQGVTNDLEGYIRPSYQNLTLESYQSFFKALPIATQQGIVQQWGTAADEWQRFTADLPATARLPVEGPALPISGMQLGNVFIGIQPSRGYDRDPSLNYHAPDLAPTHAYLGFYHWLRHHFEADAIVHVGKHGNLEWLPGKGIALSAQCYPEAAFGPMPHFYPFIVNDPGEGAQAKRRSQAIILDHLTPPMTRAELYGPLQQLESLVDEYYEAQNLDPTRLSILSGKIVDLLNRTQLLQDLNLAAPPDRLADRATRIETWLPQIDGYLCELKEAQIRDGLHIFGHCPQGRQLRDLIVAIARHPSSKHIGLTRAIAQAWQLDLDPLTADFGEIWQSPSQLADCRTVGDVVERIEAKAAEWIDQLIQGSLNLAEPIDLDLKNVFDWIDHTLLPSLRRTPDEIQNLLHGLSGGYVPSGPAGAPTRNRPEVLPTGRNFYSVDIRAIPTESAWDVGRKAAEQVIENYTQENGEYPRTLGLSMWGTAAMRTGGDDISEALALLGVRPVWDGPSRRVVDFEILPLSLLGRPRVDVTLRVSGFFRDAFPNLISLFDQAVNAVAALDEPPDQNPLAAQVRQDRDYWQRQGLDEQQSLARSRYRIFGSKPGAYGAGLQGLIEAQNWQSDADLARAYINWSGYAYTGQADGHSAPEAFKQRLGQMQIVLQNQDNREHDLLDSDDYYQFQGGLTAAVKSQRGESPVTYFGDNAVSEQPKVRSLRSEIARVYRARVVNPKWIAGVMRHGYKGAFEMAATVDYLFAYDATTGCVENHMYEGVADAYVFDLAVREFIEQSNPWALRDLAERLLEAHQRGLWQGVSEQRVDDLRAIAHTAEGQIESGFSPG